VTEWLVQLSNSRSDFLCAFSDAVIKADDNDYSIIRPALMDLKRKYFAVRPRMESVRKPLASRGAA
jgi:hypothetical protein